jgi:hypothetical protein
MYAFIAGNCGLSNQPSPYQAGLAEQGFSVFTPLFRFLGMLVSPLAFAAK